MARSFLDHGFFQLGLVPVQNSGPLTAEPDYYLHWPPFFAIFQAWIFALFGGPSVFTVHALSPALVLAQAALLGRSEEHTSELQSLMRISYAVFCLKKTKIDHQ